MSEQDNLLDNDVYIDRIGIIIAVHNRLTFTQRCLNTLNIDESKYHITVIIIDDGSTDGTSDWIIENHPHVVILKGSGNLWFGGATQLGIDYVLNFSPTFDYVLTLNNDTFIDSYSIDLMVEASKEEKVVAATYWQENVDSVGTAGRLWKQCAGLRGLPSSDDWSFLQLESDFVDVDSVATTATLFPVKFLLNSSKISLKMHPHHRYDVMLSASCRDLGAKFITSTQPLAVHIYSDRSDLISYRSQSLREFWIRTFQDPLQVDYLPGVITAFAASAPSSLQALPIIFKYLFL